MLRRGHRAHHAAAHGGTQRLAARCISGPRKRGARTVSHVKQRNRQALKLQEHHAAIAAEVARRPDVTLEELRAWLLATHEVKASLGLMHKTLVRLGLTLKKSRGAPRSRIGRTSPSSAPSGAPSKAI